MAYPLAHSPGLRYLRSMYIRRTHTNNSATGERYFTYRLVKSERVGGCTRQSTLLNLGRHFAIEQDHWPTLCARVDEIMGCQLTLMPVECPLAVECEAQRIAALLLARRSTDLASPVPASAAGLVVFDTGSVDVTVTPRRVKSSAAIRCASRSTASGQWIGNSVNWQPMISSTRAHSVCQ